MKNKERALNDTRKKALKEVKIEYIHKCISSIIVENNEIRTDSYYCCLNNLGYAGLKWGNKYEDDPALA